MVGRTGRDRIVSPRDRTVEALERYLASSPSLEESRESLERAAASDAVVLIVGEAGSGRSSLARALFAASARRTGPLVEVDPGVIPSTLFESEFFGFRAGAFTGAERGSKGRVGDADGGSLLIDPLEELPLETQAKLLRVLAEQRYAPLGDRERDVDIRFLAVASDDLPDRVARGTFREDLFYRFEVLAFRLEPLRSRPEDLRPLVSSMLEDLGDRYARDELTLSEPTFAWMQDYDWPGNLRELRNLLERAVVMANPTETELQVDAPSGRALGAPKTLREVEIEAIVQALRYTRGHQGQAAELLGISRKALWEKRKRYGLR